MTDQTDDDPYDEEENDESEFAMYRVQGTLREWVTRDEVRRFIGRKFKDFLLNNVNPKKNNNQGKNPENHPDSDHGEPDYVRQIGELVSLNKCSLEIDYKQFIYIHPNLAIWLADAPQSVLEVMEEVANKIVFELHENYRKIQQKIYVRITNLPVYE